MSRKDRMMKELRPNTLKPQTDFAGHQVRDFSSQESAESTRYASFVNAPKPDPKKRAE